MLDNQAIIEAIRNRDLNTVKNLLPEYYSKIVKRNSLQDYNLLYFSITYDQTAITEYFLEQGDDANASIRISPEDSLLPMHIARSIEMIDILIKHGADINASLSDGQTPLHKAVLHSNAELVEHLLQNNANPNAFDREARTPLHHLIKYKVLPYLTPHSKKNDNIFEQNTMEVIIVLCRYESTLEHFALSFLRLYLEMREKYAQNILATYQSSNHDTHFKEHQILRTMNEIIAMVKTIKKLLCIRSEQTATLRV